MSSNPKIELLSPAKNLEYGKIAVSHGADAVYIGAPAFGARAAVGNSIEDIEQLIRYAHTYGAKVFTALNTLLFDNELEQARRIVQQLYNAGADALIIQDMGLLEMDLPPIALHASTQTHNYSLEKILFLEKIGLQRVVLARELSLAQIQEIRQNTQVELECFVHGALCVCFSGQCYMSQFITQRSGNRGMCSQPCRSSYDLYNEDGVLLKKESHLLSLKDFNASEHLQALVESGINSFKIEGRLKDAGYLKNVTAHYRLLLDQILDGRKDIGRASSGKTVFFFKPDVERSFNRGFTDYFLDKRNGNMASPATQKSLGKAIGTVKSNNGSCLTIDGNLPIANGDGLCFFDTQGKLDGFLVNQVLNEKIYPNREIEIEEGTLLYRNNDFAFEKKLGGETSVRKIAIQMRLQDNEHGFDLQITDEDGIVINETFACEKQPASSTENYEQKITQQLTKTGGTLFEAEKVEISLSQKYFLPISVLNTLRRNAIEKLTIRRIELFRPQDVIFTPNDEPYIQQDVDYKENILNKAAVQFYKRHGVTKWSQGFEHGGDIKNADLMTTKYCIKYQLGQCPKYFRQEKEFEKPLYLHNNGKRFRLVFDCKKCEMKISMLVY